MIYRTKFVDDHTHDPKRVFLSEEKNDNVLDCIISKVMIVYVDPNLYKALPISFRTHISHND